MTYEEAIKIFRRQLEIANKNVAVLKKHLKIKNLIIDMMLNYMNLLFLHWKSRFQKSRFFGIKNYIYAQIATEQNILNKEMPLMYIADFVVNG